MSVDVLRQFSEQHSEKGSEKGSSEIKSFRSKVISIVEFSSLQSGEQQSMNHVTKEVGLLGVLTLGHRDVGKHLFLEDFLGVVDSSISSQGWYRSSTTDKVQSDLEGERRCQKKG